MIRRVEGAHAVSTQNMQGESHCSWPEEMCSLEHWKVNQTGILVLVLTLVLFLTTEFLLELSYLLPLLPL